MSSAPFRLQWQLGRPKLDRAEMLSALVAPADENPGVFGALVADVGQRGVLTPSRLGGQASGGRGGDGDAGVGSVCG